MPINTLAIDKNMVVDIEYQKKERIIKIHLKDDRGWTLYNMSQRAFNRMVRKINEG